MTENAAHSSTQICLALRSLSCLSATSSSSRRFLSKCSRVVRYDFVSRFVEDAQRILDAAEIASANGNPCVDMTVLLGVDGAIRLVADSDWPLDSLILHHGARTGYRVSGRTGAVRVEGFEGTRRCSFEAVHPARTARLLLAPR